MNGIGKTTPKFFAKGSARARYPFNIHEHEIPSEQEIGAVQNCFRIKAKGEGCHYSRNCKITVCQAKPAIPPRCTPSNLYGIFIRKKHVKQLRGLGLRQSMSPSTCLSSVLCVERCLGGRSQSNTRMCPSISALDLAILLWYPASLGFIILLVGIIIRIIVSS